MVSETFYEVLGVDRSADADEIERAYRDQVRRHHPDRKGGDTERMKRINKAKEVLADQLERKRYDRIGHREYIELERPAGWARAMDDDTGTGGSDTSDSGSTTTNDRNGSDRRGTRGSTADRRKGGRDATADDSSADAGTDRRSSGGRSRSRSRSGRSKDGDTRTGSSDTEDDSNSAQAKTDPDEEASRTSDTNMYDSGTGTNVYGSGTGTNVYDSGSGTDDTDTTADSRSTSTSSTDGVTGESDGDGNGGFQWGNVEDDDPTGGGSTGATGSTADSGSTGNRSRSSSNDGRSRSTSDADTGDQPAGGRFGGIAETLRESVPSEIGVPTVGLGAKMATLDSGVRGLGDRVRSTENSGSSTGADDSAAGWRPAFDTGAAGHWVSGVSDAAGSAGTRMAAVARDAGRRVAVVAAGWLRRSRAVERLAADRPWRVYAVPRTVAALVLFSGLLLAFEGLVGSSPGWLALSGALVASVGLSTVRESSRYLLERIDGGELGQGRSTSGRYWADDWLLWTSAAGVVGITTLILGRGLAGTGVLFPSLSIVARLSAVICVIGIGGAFVATVLEYDPVSGGLIAGLMYAGPATLFLPPDSWLAGGGLIDGSTQLWVPMVSVGPIQVGQLANVVLAIVLVFGLGAPLLVFTAGFSTILRRDTLDRGYPFTPLSWELAAMIPFVSGLALAFAPAATVGSFELASAARSLLYSSTLLWPTVFLAGYTLARLHHDGRLPHGPEDASSVISGRDT